MDKMTVMNKNKVGMLFFLGSESFFFISLIIAYAYYSHPGGKLSETARYLDVAKTSVFTFFLLASSATVGLAGMKYGSGKRNQALAWLFVTVVLGIIFLLGQGMEYSRLINQNITISKDVFGSSFFTLTGFHGLHVLAGLILLTVISLVLLSGKFMKMEKTALESISMYWHFVDAVWVVVFITVYIGAVL